MVNIYMGRDSCYARREGMYISSGPINFEKAVTHLYLHLRDLKRGYTYDHECKKVAMDYKLFEARSKYLIKLCREHIKDEDECEKVEEIVNYVLRKRDLPKWTLKIVEKNLVKVSSLETFF